jgi:hypothetical protein
MAELAGDDDIAQHAGELARPGLDHIRRVIRILETFDRISAYTKIQWYEAKFLGAGD